MPAKPHHPSWKDLIPKKDYRLHCPWLAARIGTNETLILLQLQYWLERSTNEFDGYRWVYKTHEQWRAEFPNISSINTIASTLRSLIKQEIVIVEHYTKGRKRNTGWYRINEKALI